MKTLIENHKSVKDQVQLINEADESPSLPENQKSSSNHLDTVQPLKASSSIEAVNLGAKCLGFFLLSFPQNQRKMYWFCSVSFAQFVYFLREVSLKFGSSEKATKFEKNLPLKI